MTDRQKALMDRIELLEHENKALGDNLQEAIKERDAAIRERDSRDPTNRSELDREFLRVQAERDVLTTALNRARIEFEHIGEMTRAPHECNGWSEADFYFQMSVIRSVARLAGLALRDAALAAITPVPPGNDPAPLASRRIERRT